jgi:hypothetical protein
MGSDQKLLHFEPISYNLNLEGEKIYTDVIDLKYTIDVIVLDDSYIQIEDVTVRNRKFMHLRDHFKYKKPMFVYTD